LLTHLPLIELLLGIAVLSLTSMCLGLLVSALVSTSEKAMPLLVLLTMVQVILSGGVPVSLYFGPSRGSLVGSWRCCRS
jgi:ABC-type multidrug transport system permease subunit